MASKPKPGDYGFNAYIVDAMRTAGGKKNGRLSGWHPADLGAQVVDALVERSGIDGAIVEDVIFGCVTQSGAQAENIARNVVLCSRKLPETVPGYTLDRQCGSAQQAIASAAQAVMSGFQDVIIAGGVESMSVVPMDSNVTDAVHFGHGYPNGQVIIEKYGEETAKQYKRFGADPQKFDQFVGAELLAEKYQITREDCNAFAVRSHALADAATKAGKFATEIAPVPCKKNKGESPEELHKVDEGLRPQTNMESLAKLKPIMQNGRMSAACASQLCDGAGAVIVCNDRALELYKLQPIARIVSLGLAGTDPVTMLEGPIPATKMALSKAGLDVKDLDLVEVNEAFSSVPLSWAKAMVGGDTSKLNVNGGAIARGHPMGATGAMLTASLLNELERRGGRYGLLTMCEYGGTANATIYERLPKKSKL